MEGKKIERNMAKLHKAKEMDYFTKMLYLQNYGVNLNGILSQYRHILLKMITWMISVTLWTKSGEMSTMPWIKKLEACVSNYHLIP